MKDSFSIPHEYNVKVEIYGMPSCPACIQSKKYCEDNNIPYTYYTVGVKDDSDKSDSLYISPEAFLEKCGVMSVPVIFINGVKYIGFNTDDFRAK